MGLESGKHPGRHIFCGFFRLARCGLRSEQLQTIDSVDTSYQCCSSMNIARSSAIWHDGIGSHPWYVAQVKPNCSAMAKRNLARVGCEIFDPFEEVTIRQASRFKSARRALFPGYMFASFDPVSVPFRSVNGTYGVARLVSFGSNAPAPAPEGLIEKLMERCDPTGKLLTHEVAQKGDRVLITGGPFANFVGSVELVTPQQRVWVLLDILGARRHVKIEASDLRIDASGEHCA